jgi:hypothetical protein
MNMIQTIALTFQPGDVRNGACVLTATVRIFKLLREFNPVIFTIKEPETFSRFDASPFSRGTSGFVRVLFT